MLLEQVPPWHEKHSTIYYTREQTGIYQQQVESFDLQKDKKIKNFKISGSINYI